MVGEEKVKKALTVAFLVVTILLMSSVLMTGHDTASVSSFNCKEGKDDSAYARRLIQSLGSTRSCELVVKVKVGEDTLLIFSTFDLIVMVYNKYVIKDFRKCIDTVVACVLGDIPLTFNDLEFVNYTFMGESAIVRNSVVNNSMPDDVVQSAIDEDCYLQIEEYSHVDRFSIVYTLTRRRFIMVVTNYRTLVVGK
jgi:hypothetical protein